ncbi:hypothetical protein HQ346_12280 [Rhodococcus sp. BP-252]|uniref:Uncharacterized protein n=1 Tax=Rhodococcoides kyotonense TaxID=398843 RepID=A0A177YMB8_9NOCA|nr:MULTISPECIES: Rv3235 family protein [Rhodococcus]MBY6412451.1 hypothetical protein [Rhodococcus sp. BP-320]MBY6417031.1 hypothetical protein [Rhodococcus sp. BP-321]MBY6422006.1 hypothetical protein [Rhodococcus sp. BP-324]MBY6427055.1 hypothetical protein [Rhodococcus sp. BP-323]MBY6432384.1 hypothetical protein [Rhodococcus sp. BP-322]
MEATEARRQSRLVRPAQPYEPPAVERSTATPAAPCRVELRRNTIRSSSAVKRRHPFPRSLGAHPAAAPTTVAPNPARDVPDDIRRGVDHALRLLLEVLDRRRTADQLRSLFAPAVIESIRTIVRNGPPGHGLGIASLRTVHSRPASENSVEIFATYARGPRVFALAARIDVRSGPRGDTPTVTSLRVC